jgi:hypothetical protein
MIYATGKVSGPDSSSYLAVIEGGEQFGERLTAEALRRVAESSGSGGWS